MYTLSMFTVSIITVSMYILSMYTLPMYTLSMYIFYLCILYLCTLNLCILYLCILYLCIYLAWYLNSLSDQFKITSLKNGNFSKHFILFQLSGNLELHSVTLVTSNKRLLIVQNYQMRLGFGFGLILFLFCIFFKQVYDGCRTLLKEYEQNFLLYCLNYIG